MFYTEPGKEISKKNPPRFLKNLQDWPLVQPLQKKDIYFMEQFMAESFVQNNKTVTQQLVKNNWWLPTKTDYLQT